MALISGKEAKKTEKQIAANPKLWNMVTAQAATKFSKNSPARGHWIHAKYNQLGGQYVKSKKDVDPKLRDYAQEERDQKDKEKLKKVAKPVGKKLIRGERFR
jgi:hypothetical protein